MAKTYVFRRKWDVTHRNVSRKAFSNAANANVGLVGVSSAAAVGLVVHINLPTIFGVGATALAGDIAVNLPSNVTVNLIGVQSSASVGTIKPGLFNAVLNGVAASPAVNTTSIVLGPQIVSATATALAGNFASSLNYTLSGATANALAGSISSNVQPMLDGVEASAQAGDVTPLQPGALIGVSAIAQAGLLRNSMRVMAVNGVSASATAGNLFGLHTNSLIGVQAIARAGTISPAILQVNAYRTLANATVRTRTLGLNVPNPRI